MPVPRPRSFHPSLFVTALAASALPAQWRDLGLGKRGTAGIPALSATPLQLGQPASLFMVSARANSGTFLVIGGRRLDLPFLGGTLVPSPESFLLLRTDGAGGLSLGFAVPNDPRLLGTQWFAQCVIDDPRASFGVAMSNAVGTDFCPNLKSNAEDFSTPLFFDSDNSAGTWGAGRLTFSPVGGTGEHGVFDPTVGRQSQTNPAIYEWSTDSQLIPGRLTRSGRDITVSNGRFEFSSMKVPRDVRVRFVGSNPARISVRGVVQIDGNLNANGASIQARDAAIAPGTGPQRGEPGSRGGAFGGTGGDGGDRGDGSARRDTRFDGRPGADIGLKAGHAYAGRTPNTGGRGSEQHPITNNPASIGWGYFNVIAVEMNRGGGGGGFSTAGGVGAVSWGAPNTGNSRWAATGTTSGGVLLTFPPGFPTGYPQSFTRQDHFLAGGSGGGGGGSCCAGAIKSTTGNASWRIGRGGAGGGGALGLRVGRTLTVGPAGDIECLGGSAAFDDAFFSIRGMMTPGGGGSGGSLFLQIAGATVNNGRIRAAGGQGGRTQGNRGDTVFAGADARGGDGGDGIIHFETTNPTGYQVGTTVPAQPPVAAFAQNDIDQRVTVASLWYPANPTGARTYVRYEIQAQVNGQPQVFSDDPRIGRLAGPTEALHFQVQGAQQIQRTSAGAWVPAPFTQITPFLDQVGPFMPQPSLYGAASAGYRFELTFDRTLARTVDVQKVTIYWCE